MPGRVTRNGQVTIPKWVRERLGLRPGMLVDFQIAEDGRVFLARVHVAAPRVDPGRFARLRGAATVKMTTDQIMALTRGEST